MYVALRRNRILVTYPFIHNENAVRNGADRHRRTRRAIEFTYNCISVQTDGLRKCRYRSY